MTALPPMLFPGAAKNSTLGQWFAFHGIPQNDGLKIPSTLREFMYTPADEAWVYSCALKLFSAAQSVPLRTEVKSGGKWVWADETRSRGDARDLQFLLDNVNPVSMNGADFRGYTCAAVRGIWGGAYWKKVRGRLGGPTQELYFLPVPDVAADRDPAVYGAVRQYVYAPSGTTIRESIEPKNMLRFRAMNFGDPVDMLSPLSAARNEIATNRMAGETMAATIANWNIPAGAWTVGENTSESDKGIIRRVLRGLRSPRNQGKTPVLPHGMEFKPLGLAPKDAEWLAARKVSRVTICGVMGVPLLLAGDDDSPGPYNFATQILRSFWTVTLIPALDQIADTINGWLVPEFTTRGDLRVRFDYAQIEAIQIPLEDRKQVALAEVKAQVLTPDEYRADYLQKDPLPKDAFPAPPGGEMPAEEEQPEGDHMAADAVRPRKDIYSHPAVVAWLKDQSQPLDADQIVGRPVSAAVRLVMQQGLKRRYSARQIADGKADEGYPGIRGTR